MAFFLYYFLEVWHIHIWPEIRVPQVDDERDKWINIHPQFLTISEIRNYLEAANRMIISNIVSLLVLRNKNPVKFYTLVSSSLIVLASLGGMISDLDLILLVCKFNHLSKHL